MKILFLTITTILLGIASLNITSSIEKLYTVMRYNCVEIENVAARQRVQKLRNDDLEERIKVLESKRKL